MKLTSIEHYFYDKLEAIRAAVGAGGSDQATATNQTTQITDLGSVTEAAPATDIASSGLNGRLQRIAQRLTSLIALLPVALGQGTMTQSLRVVLPSDQAAIPVTSTVSSIALPTTIYNGQKSVTTAGVRVTLASSQAILSGVTIKALVANTGTIYVGDGSVSSSTGFRLNPGDTIFLEVTNLITINLDSSVNGEGVTYVAT
jgi:hypothetical protein